MLSLDPKKLADYMDQRNKFLDERDTEFKVKTYTYKQLKLAKLSGNDIVMLQDVGLLEIPEDEVIDEDEDDPEDRAPIKGDVVAFKVGKKEVEGKVLSVNATKQTVKAKAGKLTHVVPIGKLEILEVD